MNDSGGSTDARTGLLVMAYGTPAEPEDIEAYYTHIRRGRPPAPEQLAELVGRYEALGGTSPLAANTAAQVSALESALDRLDPERWVVTLGQKHAEPFIEDGVEQLVESGVDSIVGLVLAPHYSRASVGEYHRRATETVADRVRYSGIESWHLLDELLEFQRSAVVDALADMPERTKVLFTAHSLPERALVDDPYPAQLHESAEAVAELAGLARWAGWGIGWQSKGRTPEPWRGPDVLEVIEDLGDTGRGDGLLVVPQGFTSDHLEVLYDLDIEARAAAEARGLAFDRTRVPNADGTVMGALAGLAISRVP